ncbi:MAG: glutamate/gamma-aminobutyrate family transporter YjeM [Zhenhengia sp.]|uniref:glutamate/gamma-aminobutyrate family transporter YjeM n=1 Tax=Zhenhengia sp. TaxID=2944208 RepID=UPI0039932F89
MSTDSKKQLTLFSLVLMIFTSVYGFANMPRAFFLMGYAAIPWYLIGALFFFLPYAFMMAEYGAAYKQEKGGIYSWMERSVGPKYAFIGTFMWYASYLVWQVNVSSTIWVPLSNAIFGADLTHNLTYFGLKPTMWLGILAVLWIILVTFISTQGLDKIKQVTSVGGLAVMLLNVVLLLGGFIVLILNGGQFAQPILNGLHDFAVSPNPAYQSGLSTVSFLTYAIFAYGGIEAVGGLVDQTKNAEKTFPLGVTISAIVISIGYALGIFMIGTFINWQEILSLPGVNTANVTYIVMENLGVVLAGSLGANPQAALTIGMWVARLVGLSMFLALTGAFFTLIYSPLKQLIEGTPKALWPKKFSELKNNMPVYAMYVQAVIVIILILIVAFGGDNASAFFNKLVIMTNVAMTIPYMFLSAAFPFFKKKDSIQKPFEIYKSYTLALIASIIVTVVIGFANLFSIIEPGLAKGNWLDTLLSGGGPLLFALIAFLLYKNYESKQTK